jgi:hypothetical protein
MMVSMNIDIDNTIVIEFVATPVSLRTDQREWLDAEALRQLHRNRSRLVQEAIDQYRQVQNGEMELVPVKKRNEAAS